ncbi:hypothetical protein LCGC14_1299980, partial [marine sediment metagenome]
TMNKDKWISIDKLPANVDYGWSERMLVCQNKSGLLHPTLLIASYNSFLGQWRPAMGTIENVTHWQPLPDYPGEDV